MNKMFTFMRESGPARALIPIGLILIIFGVIMFVINNQNQNYIKIESVVSNIQLVEDGHTDVDGNYVEATYDVSVSYNVSGKDYSSILPNMSKYNLGDKITIYYNPEDPSQITQTKSLILPIVIIVAGIASTIGGVISAKNAIKRYKKMKEQEKGWEHGQ